MDICKKWYADIGTHVKQGQLLAEIETPEVDQQLDQAKSGLNTAPTNVPLSEIHGDALSGPGQDRSCFKAGRRQRSRGFRGQEGDGLLSTIERETPRGAAVVREDICTVRWDHYRTKTLISGT